MRKLLAALAVVVASLTGAGSAQAQTFVGVNGSIPWMTSGPIVSAPYSYGYVDSYVVAPPVVAAPPARLYYSYYAVPPGQFARTYVPLGPSDEFPFYGRPYGRPGDRWSWSAMSITGSW